MSNPLGNPSGFRRHQQHRQIENVHLIPLRTSQEDDQRYLVTELSGARYQSDDLVDDVFGHFLPASLIGVVLAALLTKKLVKVTYANGRPVPEKYHPSAVAWAVAHAERAGCIPDPLATPAVSPKTPEHNFIWTWILPDTPNRRTETGAAQFMNSVANLAFKEIHELAPTALGHRWIQWRFGRPPRPDYAYPMPDVVENVDQRLDNHVLPSKAWIVPSEQDKQGLEELEELEEPELPSEPAPSRSDHHDRFTDAAADSVAEEDLDQGNLDQKTMADLQAAYHDTREQLRNTAANGAWHNYQQSSLPQGEPEILREGYANWTRTRIVVELKASDLPDAIRQAHLYLRTLHRAQPWLAAAHGIAMTEKQMCLLRSDAAGCEECSFKLSSGRGIIDTIRVALGTVTAEDQEFGHNPAFACKEETKSVETFRSQGTGKRQKIVQDYFCHVVDTIKLGDNIFTVQEIISSTASIRGRGTVVFKVRREDDQKHWALKRTWVDVLSESQENKLMEIARDKKVEYVLLPEEGHCWTYLDTDFMRGSVDRATASQAVDLKTRDLKTRGAFDDVELRQETYCLLPYKLPLHDFRDVKDFVSGVICILKGLDSLYTKASIIHGDVSFGNFLFDEDGGTAANPRQAWLVDLDNASIEISREPYSEPDPESLLIPVNDAPGVQQFPVVTGTGPFMALQVMDGEQREHASDVESVFYLLFLFFFTFGKPQTDPFLHGNLTWHHSIEEWTTGSLSKMARAKTSFFSKPRLQMQRVLQRYTCPEWQDDGATKESINRLVLQAYRVAWEWTGKRAVMIPSGASAKDMIKCLEAWLKAEP
ncbi:hypothetical protein B0H13DRAFT_684467 [Mycena leptocephala]|nr:hypothetical protein B0H13DRAFT_684467 [Mycena leptocephala]